MRFHFIAAIAVLSVGATQATALSADFGADFSVTNSNPNGAWTYGYTTTLGGPLTAFTAISTSATHEQWYMPGLSGDNTPSVFKNISGSPINGLPGGTGALHSGPSGEYAVARLTSMENTRVTIDGMFGLGDIGGVGVFILVDNVQVFGTGLTYVAESFSLETDLFVGSTIDFMVGIGDGGYSFDTTPLDATIESIPEPTTMAILGVAGFLAARRRKKGN